MAFQIDTFQADAFQSFVTHPPISIPMSRKRIGERIVAPTILHRYHCLATGKFSIADFILGSPNAGATAVVFNVRLNGEALWSGGDRPSIDPGSRTVQKSGFAISVTRAVTLVEIMIDEVPSIGVPMPITSIFDVTVF